MCISRSLIAAVLAVYSLQSASAQTYPYHPIKLVVPLAAGGPLDIVARGLGEKLSVSLKQPIVIENRLGAGGNIGAEAVAKAAPDGYTLLFVLSGTLVANPAIFPKLGFNTERDFVPISLVSSSSQMLVVHPSLPVNNVAEFVAYAKKQPITYAHAGPGSGGHLAMGYFKLVAGFDGTAVPYRGNAPLMTDLAAGQVQSGFIASAGAIPHVQAGRLKGLAVSSEQRLPLVPDVPTMAESGYPGMKLTIDGLPLLLAPRDSLAPIHRALGAGRESGGARSGPAGEVARQRHRAARHLERRGSGDPQGRNRAMGRHRQAREAARTVIDCAWCDARNRSP